MTIRFNSQPRGRASDCRLQTNEFDWYVDESLTLSEVKNCHKLFFENKQPGVIEHYEVYRGFLIVSRKVPGDQSLDAVNLWCAAQDKNGKARIIPITTALSETKHGTPTELKRVVDRIACESTITPLRSLLQIRDNRNSKVWTRIYIGSVQEARVACPWFFADPGDSNVTYTHRAVYGFLVRKECLNDKSKPDTYTLYAVVGTNDNNEPLDGPAQVVRLIEDSGKALTFSCERFAAEHAEYVNNQMESLTA